MKTWTDALGTCTGAGGSVGSWPPSDSDASPDIPRPLDLASCRKDALGASGPQLAACRPPSLGLDAICPKWRVGNGRLTADISASSTSGFGRSLPVGG